MEKVFRTHTNNTNEYQLVGNCCDVILQGTYEECITKMKSINIENSQWGVVQPVAPNETVSGTYCLVVEPKKLTEEEIIRELFGGKYNG